MTLGQIHSISNWIWMIQINPGRLSKSLNPQKPKTQASPNIHLLLFLWFIFFPSFSRIHSENLIERGIINFCCQTLKMLHQYRISSIDWRPSAVVALATSVDESQVAAAREDGSLEIWLVSPGSVGWHCQLVCFSVFSPQFFWF